MTGRAPSRPRPAGLLSVGRPEPLPGRPTLTTPPRLQHEAIADLQRLAAQPRLGLVGLLLAAVVFFALALGTGSTTTSLLILGPISTFALPAVAMVAFWWNDWPGSRLTAPWTGLIDTVLVAAASVVLTIAGQAIIERSDVQAVFEASPGPGVPATFPATLALAGAAFTAMLQLSLVCERWPLAGIGRLRSGLAALALSWAVGTGAYFLFVNLDAVPAAERAAAGLRNPGGPIAAPDFGSALIAVGVWQAVIFIALRGWPVNAITRRSLRLLAGNALVLGLGALSYTAFRNLAHWQPDAISAVCGCVISAALIVAMLFKAGQPHGSPRHPAGPLLSPSPRWRRSRSTAPWPPTPPASTGQEPPRTTGSPPPRSASSEPASSSMSASGSDGHSPRKRTDINETHRPSPPRKQPSCHQRRRLHGLPAKFSAKLSGSGSPRNQKGWHLDLS